MSMEDELNGILEESTLRKAKEYLEKMKPKDMRSAIILHLDGKGFLHHKEIDTTVVEAIGALTLALDDVYECDESEEEADTDVEPSEEEREE